MLIAPAMCFNCKSPIIEDKIVKIKANSRFVVVEIGDNVAYVVTEFGTPKTVSLDKIRLNCKRSIAAFSVHPTDLLHIGEVYQTIEPMPYCIDHKKYMALPETKFLVKSYTNSLMLDENAVTTNIIINSCEGALFTTLPIGAVGINLICMIKQISDLN